MTHPYADLRQAHRRYRQRLAPLTAADLETLSQAVEAELPRFQDALDAPGADIDAVVREIGAAAHARLRDAGAPLGDRVDRHDLAEIVRLLGTAGYGELLADAVALVLTPPDGRGPDDPGSDEHLLQMRNTLWNHARDQLAAGEATPDEIRDGVVGALSLLVVEWGLDPVRAETYMSRIRASVEDALGRPIVTD